MRRVPSIGSRPPRTGLVAVSLASCGTVMAERQRLTELWTGGEVFNRILPQPREFTDEDLREWRCRHWGTKWDVGGQEDPADVQERDGETTIVFCTAWNPPIPVIRAMSAIYPSLTFVKARSGHARGNVHSFAHRRPGTLWAALVFQSPSPAWFRTGRQRLPKPYVTVHGPGAFFR